MDGFCYINYADDKIYEGEMMNGAKNGYGEFTWKPIRKYIGYYVNDLKEGFGIYIWNIKTFQIYVGFWNKGKMEGIGMMINGKNIYYNVGRYIIYGNRRNGPYFFDAFQIKGNIGHKFEGSFSRAFNIPEEEYNKIPKEKIEFYEVNKDQNYQFVINPRIDLSEQNISKEANAIIVTLFQDYFATEEQKEKIKEILELNKKKSEQEKREKYK